MGHRRYQIRFRECRIVYVDQNVLHDAVSEMCAASISMTSTGQYEGHVRWNSGAGRDKGQ